MKMLKKPNKAKKLNRAFEKGLTLIEASMVLALSAVVIAGAVMYYNSAAENNKLQRAQGLLGAAQAAVQASYSTRSTYVGVNTQLLSGSTAIPRIFIDRSSGTPVLRHPWAGDVEAALGTQLTESMGGVPIAANRTYTIAFKNVPASACSSLASIDLGDALLAVSVAGEKVVLNDSEGWSSTVTERCSSNNNSKDIIWTFK